MGLSRGAKRQRGRAGGRHPQQGTVVLCPDINAAAPVESKARGYAGKLS